MKPAQAGFNFLNQVLIIAALARHPEQALLPVRQWLVRCAAA
jgi:hypothetical protein